MTRITIPITDAEHEALRKLAKKELRDARMQAAILVRQGLEREGLLDKNPAGLRGDDYVMRSGYGPTPSA